MVLAPIQYQVMKIMSDIKTVFIEEYGWGQRLVAITVFLVSAIMSWYFFGRLALQGNGHPGLVFMARVFSLIMLAIFIQSAVIVFVREYLRVRD